MWEESSAEGSSEGEQSAPNIEFINIQVESLFDLWGSRVEAQQDFQLITTAFIFIL